MSDFTFVIDQSGLRQLLTGPDEAVGKDLLRRTVKVERRAKQAAPVDTGRLRSSITSRLATDSQGLVGIVGTNVSYAIFQEFGTRYMAAQPFLRPALDAA